MANSSPITVISRAARMFLPARPTTRQRPATIRAKNSAGPNFSASVASGMATTTSATVASTPPTNEPMAAMPSADPARPWRAIAWPSMQVTTDAASPGTLIRTEVIVPPYIAP